jgi:hypothetical protein
MLRGRTLLTADDLTCYEEPSPAFYQHAVEDVLWDADQSTATVWCRCGAESSWAAASVVDALVASLGTCEALRTAAGAIPECH